MRKLGEAATAKGKAEYIPGSIKMARDEREDLVWQGMEGYHDAGSVAAVCETTDAREEYGFCDGSSEWFASRHGQLTWETGSMIVGG